MPGPGAHALNDAIKELVYIRLMSTADEAVLLSLKETIDKHSGPTEVVLVLAESGGKQAIKLPQGIDSASQGLKQLASIVGEDNLIIR